MTFALSSLHIGSAIALPDSRMRVDFAA